MLTVHTVLFTACVLTVVCFVSVCFVSSFSVDFPFSDTFTVAAAESVDLAAERDTFAKFDASAEIVINDPAASVVAGGSDALDETVLHETAALESAETTPEEGNGTRAWVGVGSGTLWVGAVEDGVGSGVEVEAGGRACNCGGWGGGGCGGRCEVWDRKWTGMGGGRGRKRGCRAPPVGVRSRWAAAWATWARIVARVAAGTCCLNGGHRAMVMVMVMDRAELVLVVVVGVVRISGLWVVLGVVWLWDAVVSLHV